MIKSLEEIILDTLSKNIALKTQKKLEKEDMVVYI